LFITITGHRPEKIPDRDWVLDEILGVFRIARPIKVIQGCASGTDLIAAYAAHTLGIPYVAAKPWGNHKSRMGGSSGFKHEDSVVYDLMIKNASEVVNVTGADEFPGNWAFFKRNEWMVDNLDEHGYVLAVWDGSNSGTSHCVNYALSKGRRVYQIDPVKKESGWIV
jgi:uncharacterized phage-like protein YoqJ